MDIKDTRIRSLEAELAQCRSELAHKTADLAVFSAAASHDLKSPLRGIKQLVSWLTEDIKNPDKDVQDNLNFLSARVQRMENLLDSLLEFSRIQPIELPQISPVDLKALSADILSNTPAAEHFKLSVVTDQTVIEANAPALRQVLLQLISNAVKHHHLNQGNIQITLSEAPAHYQINVSDDGPGIDPLYQDAAFEMLRTLQPRDQCEGSGAGLAIVKRIIELHGGKVWLASGSKNDDQNQTGVAVSFRWPKKDC